jgi:competence ComEA-like helix-hairpin-helix protein
MKNFWAHVAAMWLAGVSIAEAKRPPSAPPVAGVVNVNTATARQLSDLPGVGPSRAKAIVTYREKHAFAQVEDLRHVKGLGKSVWKRIKDHVAIAGPTTLVKLPRPEAAAGAASAPGGDTTEPKVQGRSVHAGGRSGGM